MSIRPDDLHAICEIARDRGTVTDALMTAGGDVLVEAETRGYVWVQHINGDTVTADRAVNHASVESQDAALWLRLTDLGRARLGVTS